MPLITPNDFEGFDLSENVDNIEGWAREAELFDLRESMDNGSYYATFMLETAKDPIAQEYLNILEPYSYQFEGNQYKHEGVKAVLVYYTYARYLKASNAKSSPVGLVSRSGTYTVPVQQPKINELVDQYRKQADILWQDVEFYLTNMVPAYTKEAEQIDRSNTFKIKKVAGPTPSFDEYVYFRGYNNY